jgi:hypothetical protein
VYSDGGFLADSLHLQFNWWQVQFHNECFHCGRTERAADQAHGSVLDLCEFPDYGVMLLGRCRVTPILATAIGKPSGDEWQAMFSQIHIYSGPSAL